MSKAFDCLPHHLLIAKLEAYAFSNKSLKLILTYLQDRQQSVKINGFRSLIKLLKSSVPQGSLLGPILFNIFKNDLILLMGSDIHNFADNSISAVSDAIESLVESLEIK